MHAFYLPVDPGERFCLYHPPSPSGGTPRGIVYVHPFAEEMNKARRMAALQSAQLARAGIGVLQIDLLGCGDSTGEFADARWELWQSDVRAALEWLQRELRAPLGLWGLRLGASLAAQVATDPALGIERLLLWQPVATGEQFLTQFLRIVLAAQMLSEGAARSGVSELRESLRGGRALEVGGYELSSGLARAIESVRLADWAPAVRRIDWLEVQAAPGGGSSPVSRRVVDAWRGKGLATHPAAVAGEPFWSTLEIAECPELIAATTRAMQAAP